MATSKPKDPAAPTDAPKADGQAAPTNGQADRIVLDNWITEVRTQIWGHKQGEPFVSLTDRLLAMQVELGRIAMDAEHYQGYKYHSIQSIENHVNTLSAIYKVRITPTRVGSIVIDGGARLHLKFIAYCDQTDQRWEWEWEDDGEDLTKAGSYAQKYGLMKFFHVGDGQDPDAEAERGKAKPRAQQARAATPGSAAAAPVDEEVKAKLYEIARTLPKTAGWPFRDDGTNVKIDAMLVSKMDPVNILKMLRDAQTKAGITPDQPAEVKADDLGNASK